MSETFVWEDPDGAETTLAVEWAIRNRFMPEADYIVDRSPQSPGSIVRSVRHTSRTLILPIVVQGTDPTDLRTKLRDLNVAMDPMRGAGRIKNAGPDGTTRVVECWLQDGLAADENMNSTSARTWQRLSLQFFCEEPYWLDDSPTSETIEYQTTTATFFPFFPLRLSSSSVFGSTTINNTGDVDTYPRWTITGPGSSFYIKNLTTDKTIEIDLTLSAGETLTIDTKPGVSTVRLNDGTNQFGSLSALSSLWPLVPGSNSVQLEMSSADVNSSFSYSYERRWLSA